MAKDIDPKLRKEEFGWYAFDGNKCQRCSLPLGPWHLKNEGQELFGCGMCGYGVVCGEKGQPEIDEAADRLAALLSA